MTLTYEDRKEIADAALSKLRNRESTIKETRQRLARAQFNATDIETLINEQLEKRYEASKSIRSSERAQRVLDPASG